MASPRKPLVLHVIPFLWSGAGNVVTRLCESQRRHGPIAIVTTGSRGEHPDWPSYRTRLRKAGVTHHQIDFYHRDSETFWSSLSALTKLVIELRPAVIHAHAGVPASASAIALAASEHRARLIGQMYSWGPSRPEWMNQQDALGFSQCDCVMVSAHAYAKQLREYGVPARKLRYLPWGLALETLPFRVPALAGAPTLGFVGRIEPRKGQLTLVKAFSRVAKSHPGASLWLVGPIADEAYARAIRAELEQRKLGDAVTITGEVRDVRTYVRAWDLFVSLSSDEGQGLAVLEAMAMGIPVAARTVAGISDFLTDGRNGFAIEGASPTAAAAVMRRALAAPRTLPAVARRARVMVEQRYSWERMLAAFERLYWAGR
jgi:glycosyltransferase involved in cell wall biosynthesis